MNNSSGFLSVPHGTDRIQVSGNRGLKFMAHFYNAHIALRNRQNEAVLAVK